MLYEIKMSREEIANNGKVKKVTETYIQQALTVYEAVTKFETKISELYSEHETVSCKKSNYSEVMTSAEDGPFYKAKLNILTIDERTGEDKKNANYVLFEAEDLDSAREKVDKYISDWVVDVEVAGITETNVVDYFAD